MPKRTTNVAKAVPPTHDPWDALTLSLVHANRYPCLPQWHIPLQTLTYTGFAICTHGHGWIEVNGQRFPLHRGALVVLLPGHTLASGHDPSDPVTILSIGAHIATPGTISPLAPFDLPVRLTLTAGEAREITPLFNDVIHAYQNRSVANLLAARGAFMRLAAHALGLARSVPPSRTSRIERAAPLADERIRLACGLIESRLAEPLTLADLARATHLTPPHFSLLFRNATGLSPMDFLRRRRIDRAKALLAQPHCKVETVSHEVGFADPYHFSRVFRRIVGVPPRVYAQSKRRPFFP